MRRMLLLLPVAISLVAAPWSGAAPKGSEARVASITDGDTLTLTSGYRVRLLQIDTPELGTGECYSRAARTALLALVPPGSRIVLEADPRLDRVDRYGRLLRYVHRGSVNVNVQLVRRGAAAPWFYGGERGKYAARLLAAARTARAAKRGLWKACPGTRLDPYDAVDTGVSGPPGRAAHRAAAGIPDTSAAASRRASDARALAAGARLR